jgi:hypothetical protein
MDNGHHWFMTHLHFNQHDGVPTIMLDNLPPHEDQHTGGTIEPTEYVQAPRTGSILDISIPDIDESDTESTLDDSEAEDVPDIIDV